MKKIIAIGSSVAMVLGLLAFATPAFAATINVPADYSTIQAAINAAAPGDTINVAAGPYTENIVVNKQLTINGANAGISAGATPGSRVTESIVTGGFSIPATNPSAAGTVIDGFTVQGGFLASPAFGFRVGDANGSVLNVTIQNNIIENVTLPTQSNGIEVVAGSNNLTIKNNNISNNWRGIYLNPSDGIQITGNVINSNNGVGVGIGSSGQSNLAISGNIISNNNVEGWGIDTVGTNVVANRNSFIGNAAGADWYGGTDNTINATCNWWGSASGPGGAGPGTGNTVNSTNMIFTPWLTSADLQGPCNGPLPSTVTVTINKFLDGVQATAGNANSTSFSMTAVWTGQSFGAGSGPYTLDPSNSYQTNTIPLTLGAEYSTYENLPTTCDAGNPYALAGYSTGTSFALASEVAPSVTVPDFTGMQSNEFVIVWNKTCPTIPPVTNPTDMNQCKKDGWKTFTNPSFKNQGDCVSFVATGGKNKGAGN